MAADAYLVLAEALRVNRSTAPQVLASYLHERLWNYAGTTGKVEGFDFAGDRRGWGDVVLRIMSDGRVVPLTQ